MLCRTKTLGVILFLAVLRSGSAEPSAPTHPAYLLQLPDHVQTAIIAETETHTLYRYSRRDSHFELARTSRMSIGRNGAGKERAWDRRTPLGIYFVNDRLDTTRMHEKYGVLALPLDYPNAWDRRLNRTGDGIWIHGIDPRMGQRPLQDTDGCLALSNEDLTELDDYVRLLVTPVVITRSLREAATSELEALRLELNGAVEVWSRSYQDGDWHTFFSLYAADFTYLGLDKDRWANYRMRSAQVRPILSHSVDQVLLIADPQEDNLYLSRFRQRIADANGKITTTKRLYWRRDNDGVLRIVMEGNG